MSFFWDGFLDFSLTLAIHLSTIIQASCSEEKSCSLSARRKRSDPSPQVLELEPSMLREASRLPLYPSCLELDILLRDRISKVSCRQPAPKSSSAGGFRPLRAEKGCSLEENMENRVSLRNRGQLCWRPELKRFLWAELPWFGGRDGTVGSERCFLVCLGWWHCMTSGQQE